MGGVGRISLGLDGIPKPLSQRQFLSQKKTGSVQKLFRLKPLDMLIASLLSVDFLTGITEFSATIKGTSQRRTVTGAGECQDSLDIVGQ